MYANPLMTQKFAAGHAPARTSVANSPGTLSPIEPLLSSRPQTGRSETTDEKSRVRTSSISAKPVSTTSDVYIPGGAVASTSAAAQIPSSTMGPSRFIPIPEQSFMPLKIDDVKEFVFRPIEKGKMLQFKIIRHGAHTLEWMYPWFELLLQEGEHLEYERFLLSARKRKKSRNANYLVSTSREKANMLRHDDSYIGKVRSNFAGTAFQLFGAGENPKKIKDDDEVDVRSEFGVILYDKNIVTKKGPREMKLLLPLLTPEGLPAEWKATEGATSMLDRFEAKNTDGMIVLQNKFPEFDEKHEAYTMKTIGHRKLVSSVKNFQVIHPDDPSYIMMQFGKASKDVFNLDVGYPLTVFQAFGFALSSIDGKMMVA